MASEGLMFPKRMDPWVLVSSQTHSSLLSIELSRGPHAHLGVREPGALATCLVLLHMYHVRVRCSGVPRVGRPGDAC